MGYRVLVVGKNAQSQALAYRLARDATGRLVRDVLVSPGNDGMSSYQTCIRPDQEGASGVIWTANRLEAKLVVLNKQLKDDLNLAELLVGQGHDVIGPLKEASFKNMAFDSHIAHNVRPEQFSIMGITDGVDVILLPLLKIFGVKHNDAFIPMAAVGPIVQSNHASFMLSVKEKLIIPALLRMNKHQRPIRGPFVVRFLVVDGELVPTDLVSGFTSPETQTYMHGLKADIQPILSSLANGESLFPYEDSVCSKMHPTATLNMVTRGFLDRQNQSYAIHVFDFDQEESMVFFDQVARNQERQLVTTGGQVCSCTARGDSVASAIAKSNELVGHVQFEDARFFKIS